MRLLPYVLGRKQTPLEPPIDCVERKNIVVFVESSASLCRKLNDVANCVTELVCTYGSKQTLNPYGEPDDDYDFAIRFLTTCKERNADLCIAIVRDKRIEALINELAGELKDRVIVETVPFSVKNEEMINDIRRIIRRFIGPPPQ